MQPEKPAPQIKFNSKKMIIYLDKYPDLETAYEEREDDKQDSMLQVRWGRKYIEKEVKEQESADKHQQEAQMDGKQRN